jgi:hypothetical protein
LATGNATRSDEVGQEQLANENTLQKTAIENEKVLALKEPGTTNSKLQT